MQPPAPVIKTQDRGFWIFRTYKKVVQIPVLHQIDKAKITPKKKLGVGKANSTKSIKVPTFVHSEINLLGSFMDESKTYAILQNID